MVGPRAYFVTVTKPAALSLEAVQLDDEGIYRCRVDFKNSPTRNFQVNLTVIGTDSHVPFKGSLVQGGLKRGWNHSAACNAELE